MKVAIIVNEAAWTAEQAEAGRAALANAGVEAELIRVPGHACREAARSAASRPDIDAVVAAGGDGTVSAVAGALAGGDKPLGILPAGTLNHFARDLGIPTEPGAAAATIAKGAARLVDVGEVNGHPFVNNSSIGFYPQVVQERERLRRWVGKWLALALAAARVLWRLPRIRLRVAHDHGAQPVDTPFLFVANNRYEPRLLADRQRPVLDRGELELAIARPTTRLGFLRVALRALLGFLREPRDLIDLPVRSVRVDSRRRVLHVAADGEVLHLAPPLRYQIRPRSLKVIAPLQATPGGG